MTDMIKLLFGEIHVLPYSPDDYIASNYPAIDKINDDTDFVYKDSYSNLAITFKVTRDLDVCNPSLNFPVRRNYVIELKEEDKSEVLTSLPFTINMDPWIGEQNCRLDIPIETELLKSDTTYEVQIIQCRGHIYQRHATFNLFSSESSKELRQLKITEIYLVTVKKDELFGLEEGNDENDEKYVSVRHNMIPNTKIKFEIDDSAAERMFSKPMYYLIFQGEDKWHKRIRCNMSFEGFDSIFDTVHIKYECDLPDDILEHGPVAVALQVLGKCVAATIFDFSKNEDISGSKDSKDLYIFPDGDLTKLQTFKLIQDQIKEYGDTSQPLMEINNMIGLEETKAKLKSFMNIVRLNNLRESNGLKCLDMPLHAMFLGSPGTGKTTVAKFMGKVLKNMGILSSGHVVVKDRSSLVGKFYGSEEESVTTALTEAKGGILFIDEAYQLFVDDDSRDPGKHVINSLMTALSDTSNRDWMLILAGYTEPTLKLFEINPGLESRIPETNRYHFEDFTVDQLMEIAVNKLSSNRLSLTAQAKEALYNVLKIDYDSRNETFGNARHVTNLIETTIMPSLANRMAQIESPSRKQITTIVVEDIPSRDNVLENADAKTALDKMIGLESVKAKIDSYMYMAQFNMAREMSGMPTFKMPLHSMFIGSPGTGKTTVAKLMGKLLRRAGILSKGHVVVRERSNLISKYYGEPEKNVDKAIKEARGGILFIDEAYQLVNNNDPKDPGRNMLETLMTAMADPARRDWMLILAGYHDEMNRIFEINPGLKSRIPESNIFKFEDYGINELVEIASEYFVSHRLTLDNAALEALNLRLKHDYDNRDCNFGNARHVVNLIETSILPNMASRLASSGGVMSDSEISMVRACDIPVPVKSAPKRLRLGFAV